MSEMTETLAGGPVITVRWPWVGNMETSKRPSRFSPEQRQQIAERNRQWWRDHPEQRQQAIVQGRKGGRRQ